ncbi:MAG: hypothetical protein ACD_73C00093G0002 [uncultured bacterium]|nr:MAG: hypothetical protein ACD_73C00093G0002 [uncultured bacterium]
MKNIFYILAFIILSLSGGESRALAGDWIKLESGIHYRSFSPDLPDNSDNKAAYIHAFRINPQKYEIRPIYDAGKRSSATMMLEEKKALVVVNANFFDPAGKPLGLVVQNKKILNPFKNISWWGLLRIEDDWLSIIHSSEYSPKDLPFAAVQAGPRLIVNKTIPKLKDEFRQRTAVGITKKGELIILSVLKPMKLTELASLMLLPEKKGGLECIQALNLDGGSSTQMAAHIGDFELKLPSYISVPVGLGVFRK